VLYVPLHLIDATKDLTEELERFVKDEGCSASESVRLRISRTNLLIIFDGLDELASQVKQPQRQQGLLFERWNRTVEKRNFKSELRVLISGRELVVQDIESEFRRPPPNLTLLPYLVRDGEEYYDPGKLLKDDLRQQWWKNYGDLTGRGYKGLPSELDRGDLDEITAQPLLNYLVALSFTRDKTRFH